MKEYKLEKGKLFVREVERISAGICPYCREEVWASEGQAIKYRKHFNKFDRKWEENPTHKICRKENARR